MGTDRTIQQVAELILQKLSYIEGHTSATSERLATGVLNNILTSRRYQFDSMGIIELSWAATCGAIEVVNHTGAPIYVSSSARSGDATPSMPQVDAGTRGVVNVGSRNVTLYGEAEGHATLTASTKGFLGGNAVLSVDGGVL